MNKTIITSAILFAFGSGTAIAKTQEQQASEDIEKIEITGSRIKRTDLEGVEPVVTISEADIKAQGHANVFDALQSLSMNTGVTLGEEVSNNFNANAQSINLRGFGAGYTLTLINGRRVPVLPKPSGSVSGNVVNLAMIPTEAVARVEVLSGGASAIYGSDAVAGVVNIILKDDIDFTNVTARLGDTKDGGGASKKFSITTGNSFEKWKYTAGIELDQRDPIYGDDRDWFDEPEDGPDVSRHHPSQVMSYWARYQPKAWMLADIGDKCADLGYEATQPGWLTEEDAFDPDPQYCGDNVYPTYTVRNERDRLSGYANVEYETDDGKIFATLLATKSEADAGLYRYGFAIDYDVMGDIQDSGTWMGSRHAYRAFRSHEVPTSNQSFEEDTVMLITGIEGVIAEEYDYSLSFTASKYNYEDSVVRFNDQAMLSLMFGEKGVDWDQPWEGSRWVTVNADTLNPDYTPKNLDYFGQLTPDMFDSALHKSQGIGDSYLYNLSFDIAGTLTELPAGDLQFALVTEYIKEGYEFITDEETVNGDVYGWSGIVGKGDRDHYAIGLELAIPLVEADSDIGSLEAKLAGRYDYYDDESDVGGAFTYQVGLMWRPTEELLIRSSHATSFRAPDMHYMYAQRSSSYTTSVDYLSCVNAEGLVAGDSWADCGENYATGDIRRYSEGDLSLKEESGYSTSIGMVADLTETWALTVDFYEISLENQVGIIGSNTLARYEAECNLGFDQWGGTVDPNSAKCVEMLQRVDRGGPQDSIVSVTTSPFNTGVREQTGMDITSSFTYSLNDMGNIFANVNYTHIFETKERYLPEDELEDIRDKQWNNEFRTRTDVTVGWYNDTVSVSLYANRLGTSPVTDADDASERYDAWTRYNLNAQYQITDNFLLSASVVNLFDEKPPQHESEKYWPFADVSKYNPVGMEYFISASYTF